MKIRYQLQNTTCDKTSRRSIEKTTRGQSWNGASFVTAFAAHTGVFHRSQSHFRPKQKHFPRLFQSLSLNSPPSFTYMSNLICKSYSLEIAAWITVVLFPSLHLLFIFNLKANILNHTHASL